MCVAETLDMIRKGELKDVRKKERNSQEAYCPKYEKWAWERSEGVAELMKRRKLQSVLCTFTEN